MLANCDKMVLSSSTPNEWPQLDETGSLMASNGRAMEMIKPSGQQDQQPLKCPRCDSLNTKFCYYNNYSLSQPRHFCKACKRYWTRGGTLRNVPVGGGYRKNKRVKRPSSSSSSSVGSETNSIINPKPTLLGSNISPTDNANSMFYGLPNSLYDHHNQSQMSSLGLNFPSSTWASTDAIHQDYGAGFNSTSTANQMQDMVSSSNSILANLSLLGSSSSTAVSMLSSGLQQQKLVLEGLNKDIVSRPTSNLQGLLSFEGLQGMIMKEVKSEESENQRMGYRMGYWGLASQNNLIEPIRSSNVNGSMSLNPLSIGSNWSDLTN